MSWLSGTKFAVFGLGDSTYSHLEHQTASVRWYRIVRFGSLLYLYTFHTPTTHRLSFLPGQFCVAAIGFDTRLGELGGQRMLKRGVGDDRDEDRYYTGWEAWLPELWKVMGLPQMPLSQACRFFLVLRFTDVKNQQDTSLYSTIQ